MLKRDRCSERFEDDLATRKADREEQSLLEMCLGIDKGSGRKGIGYGRVPFSSIDPEAVACYCAHPAAVVI